MSQENVDVVRRLLDAMEAEDLSAALACLDPDLEFVPLRVATEGSYRGLEGFERFYADTTETFEISSRATSCVLSGSGCSHGGRSTYEAEAVESR